MLAQAIKIDTISIMAQAQETAPKISREELWIAKRNLKRVQSALLGFPRGETQQLSSEFDLCRRSRRYNDIGFYALKDGVAVVYTTEEWLEDRSHRFIFPDNGDPKYHREAFHVDCQKIPTLRIDLEGATNIIANRGALSQLRRITPTILNASRENWQNLEVVSSRVSNC